MAFTTIHDGILESVWIYPVFFFALMLENELHK